MSAPAAVPASPAPATAAPALRIGLLGLGTVGCGVVELLRRNGDLVQRRIGRELRLVCVSARDAGKARPVPLDGLEFVHNAQQLVRRPDLDVVVELIGGLDPARQLVRAALAEGRHVVTANKALLAEQGTELFALARRHGARLGFEAAVGGGMPLIKVLREGLVGNRLESITGIVNGTCNYVLGAMEEHGREFAQSLQEAGEQGYTEADPSADVGGLDAAQKLAVLAALAFDLPLRGECIYREGIEQVAAADLGYAGELGYRLRHLAIARRHPRGIELRTHPALLPKQHPLAAVRGVMNAVLLQGDAAGSILLRGAGAGAAPTASAVLADLADLAAQPPGRPGNAVPGAMPGIGPGAAVPERLPMAETCSACYLRVCVTDRPGALAEVSGLLSDSGISIEAVSQKEPPPGARHATVLFITRPVREHDMNAALRRLEALPALHGPVTRLRIPAVG